MLINMVGNIGHGIMQLWHNKGRTACCLSYINKDSNLLSHKSNPQIHLITILTIYGLHGHKFGCHFKLVTDSLQATLQIIRYRKHPQISRTFFPKIVAQNRGCSLSAGTFQKGAVHFIELTLLWKSLLADLLQ